MNRSIVICAYGVALSVMAPAMAQEEDQAPPASTEQQPVAPGAFSGFYLGMGGGAVILDTKSDEGRTNAAYGHDYGLLGGYGTQLPGTRIYLGAELHGQFGVGDLETAETTERQTAGTTTVTIQRGSQETWGASGLFGVVTSPAMMIYGRGGYSWANLGASATDPTMGGDPARSSADSSGVHYGIGADAILTSKLTLRTEWLQTQLDTLPAVAAAPSAAGAPPAAVSPRLEPRLNQFQLSLLWRFGGAEPAPPAANAAIKNGVYFGFGSGYQASSHTNNDVCATGQTCDLLYQGRLAVNGINAQGYIGFGVAAGEKYYAAVEAGYGRLLRDNTTQTYDDASTSRVDIKNELAGSLIVGRLFRPDLMAYLRLGYQRGSFNYRHHSPSGRSSDSKKLDAFVFGIGTETALPRGLFARVEWQYMDYRTWRVATSDSNLARTLGDQDHYRLLAGVGIRL